MNFLRSVVKIPGNIAHSLKEYVYTFDSHSGVRIFKPKRLLLLCASVAGVSLLVAGIFPAVHYVESVLNIDDFRVDQKDIIVTDTSTQPDQASDSKEPGGQSTQPAASNPSTPSKDTGVGPEEKDPDGDGDGDGDDSPSDPPIKIPPPPEVVTPIRIMAVGDIACDPYQVPDVFKSGDGGPTNCHFKKLGNIIRKQNPNALFLLGDMQYNYSQFTNGNPNSNKTNYERMSATYGTYWKDLLKIAYPVPGNHDYVRYMRDGNNVDISENYYSFFGRYSKLPQLSSSSLTSLNSSKGYYSFDLTTKDIKWHIIGLNTNEQCIYVKCSINSEQGKWLAKDLTNNAATKCTIIMAHYPPKNAAPSDTEGGAKAAEIGQKLFDLQISGKADIALFGHAHQYERLSEVNGTRTFIAGNGGKSHTANPVRGSNSEYFFAKNSSALQLELYSSSYRWTVYDDSGNTHDSGKGTCSKQ